MQLVKKRPNKEIHFIKYICLIQKVKQKNAKLLQDDQFLIIITSFNVAMLIT